MRAFCGIWIACCLGASAWGNDLCFKKLDALLKARALENPKAEIRYTTGAAKDYEKIDRSKPTVLRKLNDWVRSVQEIGLHETRKVPGFHDEPLVRNREQRSVRLNEQYRLIYKEVKQDGKPSRLEILEITPHKY